MTVNWMVRYWSRLILKINPFMSLKKLFNFDNFLQHLKLESERYASQNGRTFTVSVDKLWAVIGIISLSPIVLGNRKSFRLSKLCSQLNNKGEIYGILSNLHFFNNKETFPWEHPDHDRACKVRCLIDYVNEYFLNCVKVEVEQSVEEHIVQYKGKRIMRQHIKNKPIKRSFSNVV